MTWLKRHGASLALAAVLAVIGGAAVGCSSTEDGPNNTGGTGGDAGAGGTGGTGGEDPNLCGTKVCGDGEKCNRSRNPPRCECTSAPEDSCAAADPNMMCNAQKVCVAVPPEPDDFVYCDGYGFEDTVSADGKFYCMPLQSGRAVWVRLCMDNNDQCVLTDTVCLKDQNAGTPFCWFNLCDEDNTDNGEPNGNKVNGSAFGACDTSSGVVSVARTPRGTCLPQDDTSGTVWVCTASGDAVAGDACRFDSVRGDADLCGQGTMCLSSSLPATACTTDADCDSAQVCKNNKCELRTCAADADCGADRYCHAKAKVCQKVGECFETCNAGTADITGDYATCTSTENGCFGLGGTLGYCNGPLCDMIDGGCETGEVCQYAGAAKDQPRAGLCEDGSKNTAKLGDDCGTSLGVDCEEGLICVGSDQDGYKCRAVCECEGTGGWNTDFSCKTSTSQCAAEEVCANVGLSNFMGACFPKAATQP